MSPGKDETRVCGYIHSEFIHWALWRTLMRTEYFLFVHHTTSILAKLSTWCFDISCSLLVKPSHTDESWEGRNNCLWIYMLNIYYIYTIYIYILYYTLSLYIYIWDLRVTMKFLVLNIIFGSHLFPILMIFITFLL